MASEVPPLTEGGRLLEVENLGSGTRMVTQHVVLLSRTSGDNEQMSERVDSPSPRTSPPPPPPHLPTPPPGGVNGVGALWAWKSGGCEGLTARLL